jgi:hypothetical protein
MTPKLIILDRVANNWEARGPSAEILHELTGLAKIEGARFPTVRFHRWRLAAVLDTIRLHGIDSEFPHLTLGEFVSVSNRTLRVDAIRLICCPTPLVLVTASDEIGNVGGVQSFFMEAILC